MVVDVAHAVFVIDRHDLESGEQPAVLRGAAIAVVESAPVAMTGPGVIECLQGVLTNDVEARGERGFIYGAVLTPKGMILCDLWVARDDEVVMLFPSSNGTEVLLQVFQRSLPPRLARYEDRKSEVAVLRAAGPEVDDRIADAGITLPDEGRTSRVAVGGVSCLVARPPNEIPFAVQFSCDAGDCDKVLAALESAGLTRVSETALELARIEAGWPRLGSEIDKKTLPQEVRYEELDGVSYTKGCYIGQETVARVHFRGHVNRRIVALECDRKPDITEPAITLKGKTVGRLTSVVWVEGVGRYLGLGILKRDISAGQLVQAGGVETVVERLPGELGG